MFNENIKALRHKHGYSQEELAARLHVVRQTVSKWEKGLSVPDAAMLIQIADVFEVSVSVLLGARMEDEKNTDIIAEQLSRINEQLAVKNRRSQRLWKAVKLILITIVVVNILLIILSTVSVADYKTKPQITQNTVTT